MQDDPRHLGASKAAIFGSPQSGANDPRIGAPPAGGPVAGVDVDADALFRLRHFVAKVPERRLAPTGRPGGFAGKRKGTGLETVDVRPFAVGDDSRHIDAAATARTGKPHVRTFRDEREKTALLVADFRPAMLWGTRKRLRSVAAAEALAIAGWRVIEAGGRVGLMAIGAGETLFVPPKAREKGMAEIVGGLARAHAETLAAASEGSNADGGASQPTLEAGLERAARLVPTGSTLFLASGLDRVGDDFDSLVLALRRRAHLVALLVRDRFEDDPPRGAYPFIAGGNPARSEGEARPVEGAARLAGVSAGIRWAFVSGSNAQPRRADERIGRLERLGVEVRIIAADADAETLALALATDAKAADDRRS